MYFSPFVIQANMGNIIPVTVDPASKEDLDATHGVPTWQTDWTSEYLSHPAIEKFAVKSASDDLIALAAYQILGHSAYVYILYAESAPHSNPTMNPAGQRKYLGIGELLIAYGIKYSIDNGCRGDVVFDAKTDALARHYELDFHAKRIPSMESGGPKRYMLADEDAWRLFSKYLMEDKP